MTFYPYNKSMQSEFIGKGKGKYRNVNVSWQTGLTVDEEVRENNTLSNLGNNEYKLACDSLLFPMVKEYNPDIIIISCGLDSAMHDFLGWSKLSPLMYFYMTT